MRQLGLGQSLTCDLEYFGRQIFIDRNTIPVRTTQARET